MLIVVADNGMPLVVCSVKNREYVRKLALKYGLPVAQTELDYHRTKKELKEWEKEGSIRDVRK